MKKLFLFFTLLVLLTNVSFAQKIKQIDDWDTNATVKEAQHPQYRTHTIQKKYRRSMTSFSAGGDIAPVVPMAAPMAYSRKIGVSVGGAKDTNNFTDNIKNGYLPKIDSLSYEGTFYQHYFNTALKGECQSLFCPSYSQAMTKDMYTGEKYYYLSVGLNSGIDANDFQRKKLNLVVVLDISGSMGSSFNHYANGKKSYNSGAKSKMKIANEAIVSMMKHLEPNDRFGVVLFDNDAYKVKPLRKVKNTNMRAIKNHILAIEERGGTNWSAGYKAGMDYFKNVRKRGYENRIIFITDAMPNSGELRKRKLFGMTKDASRRGIHTTFIGVGVDFNADLVEYVSKVKGANYYAVHSSKSFKKRMDKAFDYMVTPLAYNLKLKLQSRGYKIDAVYGVPQAQLDSGEIMKVNTLFPSESKGKKNKGGVILLRLKKTGHAKSIKLSVSYVDTRGKRHHNVQKIHFKKHRKAFFDNKGIRKAILLSQYVTLMKNWMIDTREICNDNIIHEQISYRKNKYMTFPIDREYYKRMKTWERKSCKLKVNREYRKAFQVFKKHYHHEMRSLRDKSLKKELKVLNRLAKRQNFYDKNKKIDDWDTIFGRIRR